MRAAPASLPLRISLMSATVSCRSASLLLKLSIRLLTVIPVVNQALGEVLFTSVVRLTRRPFASFRSCL